MLDQLISSNVLTISRFPDFDHFRNIERLGDASSIPLHWRNFAACVATVTLKSCSIFVQRTFPRILQARYNSPGAIVGFGMDDAASVIINGVDARPPSLLLVKGEAVCEILEPQANLLGFVRLDSVEGRGWPGKVGEAQLITTRPAALAALRSTIRDILLLASNSADLFTQHRVIEHIDESLLQALDHLLETPSRSSEAGRRDLSDYLRLVRELDEFLQHNAAKVPHSADLAKELGVSVRTLNNAVGAIRGMAMHRYIRLRRLWNVRQQLIQGGTAETLALIALANGFWNMSDFRMLYRDLFGETPQRTLAVARER